LQKQQRLISVWAEFKQSVIDKAINQWRPRLRACVRASGQHFERLINWNNCLSVERFCFYKDTFVRTSNLKANIHIVPFQFVKNSYFKFLQGSVVTLFRWSWKILSYFVANLSKTLHINFCQNRSSIVEVDKKILVCFLCLTVYVINLLCFTLTITNYHIANKIVMCKQTEKNALPNLLYISLQIWFLRCIIYAKVWTTYIKLPCEEKWNMVHLLVHKSGSWLSIIA